MEIIDRAHCILKEEAVRVSTRKRTTFPMNPIGFFAQWLKPHQLNTLYIVKGTFQECF